MLKKRNYTIFLKYKIILDYVKIGKVGQQISETRQDRDAKDNYLWQSFAGGTIRGKNCLIRVYPKKIHKYTDRGEYK